MKEPFTEHVRSLAEESDVAENVLDALQDALRYQLRRRGILNHSPSLLGYTGQSWHDAEPMDDLVHDCYVFAILQRFRALKNQLKQRDNVDGFVRQNIQHFLTERQKRANPIRYSLFKNLEAALSELVGSAAMKVDGLDEKRIRADCVFHTMDVSSADPASADEIRAAVLANQELATSIGELGTFSVYARKLASEAVRTITASGIRSFRLRDLLDVLADQMKSSGAGKSKTPNSDRIWEESEEGFWRGIRIVRPDARYEEKEQFDWLVKQMREAIDRLERYASVRKRILRVFDFIVESIESGEDVTKLTYADIGRKLRIARATLAEDISTLRKMSEQLSTGG